MYERIDSDQELTLEGKREIKEEKMAKQQLTNLRRKSFLLHFYVNQIARIV